MSTSDCAGGNDNNTAGSSGIGKRALGMKVVFMSLQEGVTMTPQETSEFVTGLCALGGGR